MSHILIDENLPIDCRHWFSDGIAETVEYRGWKGVENGRLLMLAVNAGFGVFLTADEGIRSETHAASRNRLEFVILPTNNFNALKAMQSAIVEAAHSVKPGEILKVR